MTRRPNGPSKSPVANRAIEELLSAIVDDDRAAATKLLRREPALATCQLSDARLYDTTILHWLYAKDTPLHLAAAGYRVRLAQSLIDAGADPNAAANHRRGRPLHYAADGYVVSPEYYARQQVRMLRCLLD